MCGEAVPQRMWVQLLLEARSLSGFFASVPDHFGGDRGITGMPAVAWKQPYAGLSPQAAPVLLEFVEQFWAEQNIAIFATFTALDVDHHALAVHVANFQTREFGTPESGGVERHQQSAMEGRASRIDESRHFLLAEDRWQVNGLLRVGCFRVAPGFLECLDVEKAKRRQVLRHCVRRELPLLKQRGLIFTNVSRT